jgi:uroporphyrinogen-III synthase
MCEVRDCNVDDDCKRNLICAQQHQEQLKKRGLDIQKGRCYNTIPANYTLCIPPKWLVKPKKECEIDWYVALSVL